MQLYTKIAKFNKRLCKFSCSGDEIIKMFYSNVSSKAI